MSVIYPCVILYCAAFAMSVILAPLFAQTLGLSPLEIALVVTIPNAFTVATSLIGGLVIGRTGEKPALLLCFGCAALAAAVLYLSPSAIGLLAAQVFMGLSRSLFWTAAISYVSRMPGQQTSRLALFNGGQHMGMLLGFIATGYLLAWGGYSLSFLSFAFVAALSLVACLGLPALPLTRVEGAWHWRSLVDSLSSVARIPAMYLAGISALLAAAPLALIGSFYPLLMNELDFDKATIGTVTAFHNIAFIVASLGLAYLMKDTFRPLHFTLATVIMGTAIASFVLAKSPAAAAAVSLVGAGASTDLTLMYQSIVARSCAPAQRGVGAAFANEFWALGMMLTPVIVGLLAQFWSVETALLILGLTCSLAGLLCTPKLVDWLRRPAVLDAEPPPAAPAL